MNKQQTLILLLIVLTLQHICCQQNNNRLKKWADYQHKHHKSYSNVDAVYRYSVFDKNLDEINKHNAIGKSHYKLGETKFTDLSTEEFTNQFLNSRILQKTSNQQEGRHTNKNPKVNNCSPVEFCLNYDEACECNQCKSGYKAFLGVCAKCGALANCLLYDDKCDCKKCKVGYVATQCGTCKICTAIANCQSYDKDCQCQTCKSGFQLSGGQCISCTAISNCQVFNNLCQCTQCVTGFQLIDQDCQQCQEIQNCAAFDSSCGCKSCKTDFTLNLNNLCCANIQNCQSYESDCTCNQCNNGYILNTNECIFDTSFETFDQKSNMRPVDDQGSCGSCWAWTVVQTVESLKKIKNNESQLEKLSVEQMKDCEPYANSDGYTGCDGGWLNYAFDYARDNGLFTEDYYPYTPQAQACQYGIGKDPAILSSWRINGHQNINNFDETTPSQITQQLKIQPLAIAISANAIQNYVSGVFDDVTCADGPVNHAVVLIGQGIDATLGDRYWLVQNSWSSDWGENGYIRIKISTGAGICNINDYVSYPTSN